MTESPTLLLSKMSSLFIILEQYGIDIKEFLSSEGIDPLMLDSPDSRICIEIIHSMVSKAESLTGDINLGLHQGEIYSGLPSVLCHMMMSCSDLGMAIEKLYKYQLIVDDTKHIDLLYQNDSAVIHVAYKNDFYDMDKHLADYQLCALYSFFQFLTGKKLTLEKVRFKHVSPKDISEYYRIFKCPLVFQSNINAIAFKKDLLKTPLLQPNRKLLALFDNHAEKSLQKYLTPESYTRRVSCFIAENLQGSVPSIKTVAKHMANSVRKLQLKLKEEGTSYSKLLNKIRLDHAIEHLKENNASVAEISYLLGFSDPIVFHRFFKKNTGFTPLKYRQGIKNDI